MNGAFILKSSRVLLLLLLSLPFVGLVFAALPFFTRPQISWLNVQETLADTALLLTGSLILAGFLGALSAFFMELCDIKLKRLLHIVLLLPLALPSYLVIFAYGELLDSFGPIQSLWRQIFGFKLRKDYYFPEPRSLYGAIFVFGFTLYPYVYLALRTSFMLSASAMLGVGLSLGASKAQAVRRIAFKIAMPAFIAGLLLIAFEVLNDVGVAQFTGVSTFPVFIMLTWQQHNNLAFASLFALFVFAIIIVALVYREKLTLQYRMKASVSFSRSHFRLRPWQKILAQLFCLKLSIFGFFLPFFYILSLNISSFSGLSALKPLFSSVFLSLIGAFFALMAAILLLVHRRQNPILNRITTSGYAMPGNIVALGLLSFIFLSNHFVSLITQKPFTLLSVGGFFVLILAYVVRFITLAMSHIETHKARLSSHYAYAARTLGAAPLQVARRIEWPLMKPAIIAAFTLIFIDLMKELPLTLLLRPVGLETLATKIYEAAMRGAFNEVAPHALFMAVLGLIPVYLLSHAKNNPQN